MIFIYSDKIEGAYKAKMLPVVVIARKHRHDKGLRAHELEHVKQWLAWFAVTLPLLLLLGVFWLFALIVAAASHDILYTFNYRYKLWCEVKAFRTQLKHGGSINAAAKALSENYGFNISHAEAVRLLQ